MMIFLLNILFFFSSGCSSDRNYTMTVKNPTEYLYFFGIDSVKMIIKQKFSHGEFYGLDLACKEDILITKIFDNPSNYNDFVLEEFSTWHKCKSKVYFNKENKPLIYHATYQIHLEKVSESKTKVSIIVTESGIIYKTKLPVLPHLSRVNRLKELPPTTVEEYEILLIIGKELGVKDMPSIKIPEKIII